MSNTPPPIDDLPYRPCVGICLMNPQGRVWVGHRIADEPDQVLSHPWQMPQGGIDPGEDPSVAVFRELYEETGIRSARIIGEVPDWLSYDYLPETRASGRFRHRGQRQKWFALRFDGADSEIDLTLHEPEFNAWRWVDLPEVPELATSFKREIYAEVVRIFTPLAQDLAAGRL